MDSFVSTTRNAVDWLLRKPERSMHKVAEWLKENDLGQYIAKFEEYGWDELSVLSDMTLGDIAMCIQKPGHKAKFKRALRSFRCKQERAKTAMTEEYAPISGIITFDEEKEDTTEPIPETGYLDKQYDIDDIDVESDSESEQESFFDFKEPLTGDFQSTNEPALATSNALFIDENEEEDVEKSPVPLAGVEDYHTTYNAIEPDMCNEECLMAEQEVFEYAISIPGVSCNVNNVVAEIDMLFDGILSTESQEKDKSEQITVLSRSASSESPTLGAVGGEQTVNLTIIKHSENTTITDGSSDRNVEDCETIQNAEENLHGQSPSPWTKSYALHSRSREGCYYVDWLGNSPDLHLTEEARNNMKKKSGKPSEKALD